MLNYKKPISRRTTTALYVLAVLFLTFLAYYPCLNSGFTNWDEDAYLLRNPDIRNLSFENITRIFRTTILKTYSPLTVLSFAFEYHFFQYNPRVYHIMNLVLHLGVTLLVFLLSRQCGLTLRGAFFSSLLFGLHPIHVESVAWVVQRKDVLYALFYLSSACAYLAYLRQKKWKLYWLAVICGLGSILAKAMAISLPLVLWLCEWMTGKRRSVRLSILEKIPFFLYLIPIGWITYSLNARIPGEGFLPGLLIWIWTFTFYIKNFLVPMSLVPIYHLPQPIAFSNPAHALAVLLFLSILTLAFLCRDKKWFIFSLLYYFLSIFFCLRFDQKVDVNIVADRFMYLPCLGFCLALGYWADVQLNHLKTKSAFAQKSLWPLVIILYVLLGMKTSQQCAVWKNSFTLWNYVLQNDPREASAYDNLAAVQMSTGADQAALINLKKSIALDPKNFEAFNNLGLVYQNMGDDNLALKNFKVALEINPDCAACYSNQGISLKNQKDFAAAQQAFEKAISLDPRLLEPRLNLAAIFKNEELPEPAERLYLQNLAIDPNDTATLIQLVNLYLDTDQLDKTIKLTAKILNNSSEVGILWELAETFILHYKFKLAIVCYQEIISKDSKQKFAYVELGKIYGNFEKYDAAIAIWEEGARRFPQEKSFPQLITTAENLKKAANVPARFQP